MRINVLERSRKQWRRWHYLARSLEWPARLGWGLLAASAVLAAAVLGPAQQKLQQTEREVAAQRRALEQNPRQQVDRSPEAVVAGFYRILPPENALLEQVAQVLETAEENGIEADKIEYAAVADPGNRLRRYEMTMPLRGTYTDMRYFMIDLLNRMPALAISELSFRREEAHSDQVETRLRLTFYLGRGA